MSRCQTISFVGRFACSFFLLVVGTTFSQEEILPIQPGSSVHVDSAIEDKNGFGSLDRRKQFQKRLLEFVPPIHRTPSPRSQLIESLSNVAGTSIPGSRTALDQLLNAEVSVLQQEQLARITDNSIRMQLAQREGVQVGGSQSMVRAGGLAAKNAQLKALADLHREKVEELRARFEAEKETRSLRLENRLSKVMDLQLKPTNVISGAPQNVILNALHEPLLKYGYTIAKDPNCEKQLNAIKMSGEDISKIRLRLDAEGKPILFNLDESPADLGRIPFAMQHPSILPVARKIESRLDQLRTTTNSDLYSTLRELNNLHSELEQVSIEILGTSRENATKGAHAYRIWCLAKDYRDKIRGILNRIEAEGTADGGWFRHGSFDPAIDGENILSLAKYIVENGCQIAPGLAGSEGAYLKLHMNLLRLQVIFETE